MPNCWEQIGGDVNADRYGAILAKYGPPEHNWIDVVEIRSLEDSLRDDELLEFGAGYLVGISSFDPEELDGEFEWALEESGIPPENWPAMRRMSAKDRRLFVANTIISTQGTEDTEAVDGTFGDAIGRFIDDERSVRWWGRNNNFNYDPLAVLRGQTPEPAEYSTLQIYRGRKSALTGVRVQPYIKWRP